MLNILVISSNAELQRLIRNLITRWLTDVELSMVADSGSASKTIIASRPDIVLFEMSRLVHDDLRFVENTKAGNSSTSLILLCHYPYLECFDGMIPKGITGYFDIGSDAFVEDLHRCMVHVAERKNSEKSWDACRNS